MQEIQITGSTQHCAVTKHHFIVTSSVQGANITTHHEVVLDQNMKLVKAERPKIESIRFGEMKEIRGPLVQHAMEHLNIDVNEFIVGVKDAFVAQRGWEKPVANEAEGAFINALDELFEMIFKQDQPSPLENLFGGRSKGPNVN